VATADATHDAAVLEAVKAQLISKDPEFLGPGQVEVKDGVVTLRGTALKPGTMYKAVTLSHAVPGVVRVVNRVVIIQ
jgi:osmotically-inducible protein OsmY